MRDVVNVHITGRLGNILFQTAAGATYAKQHDKQLLLDIDSHQYNMIRVLQAFRKGTIKCENSIKEPKDQSVIQLENVKGNVSIRGYFEKEQYFDTSLIRELYKEPGEIKAYIDNKYGDLSGCVGIHIRRGDFTGISDKFICLNEKWYEDMYHKYFEGKRVIASSDDIKWAKEHIGIDATYVQENPEITMYTLSHCGGLIGSASTFSWWCAWMNEREDGKYVFPDRKYKDGFKVQNKEFIPPRWITEPVDKYAL